MWREHHEALPRDLLYDAGVTILAELSFAQGGDGDFLGKSH
jgi:hypothetical protein